MKDLEINIRDWADRENVVVDMITETYNYVEIYTDCVHFEDLCKLNNMVEGYHISFIENDLDKNMRITMVRND